SLWEIILLYQSATYKHPSGPNSIFTGLNQSSFDVKKSGRCSAETEPSSFRTILTAFIALVIGFAMKATSFHSLGKLPSLSSAKARLDIPVPPTRNLCNSGIHGWYGRRRSLPIPGKPVPISIGTTEYPRSLASCPYHWPLPLSLNLQILFNPELTSSNFFASKEKRAILL